MKNRKRTSSDALAGVDELLRIRPLYEANDTYTVDHGSDENDSPPDAMLCLLSSSPSNSPFLKKCRAERAPQRASQSYPPSSFVFESMDSSQGLGESEMELLNRGDEAAADQALFLAEAVATIQTQENLCELVEMFACTGTEVVLTALKRSGRLELFFDLLLPISFATLSKAEDAKVHATFSRFVAALVAHTDLETFCRPSVVSSIVHKLDSSSACANAAVAKEGKDTGGRLCQQAPPSASPQRRHWADVAGKRSSSKKASPLKESAENAGQVGTRLQRCLDALNLSLDTSLDNFSVLLHLLLGLVLRQNRQGGELPEGTCVARLFAKFGGLQTLSGKLETLLGSDDPHSTVTVVVDILSFLEVVTASNRIGCNVELNAVAKVVVTMLASSPSAGANLPKDAHRDAIALRVLTNITGISPQLVLANERAALGALLHQKILTRSGSATSAGKKAAVEGDTVEDDEEEVFSLCCAVNVIKWERKEHVSEFTTELLQDGSGADFSAGFLAAPLLSAAARAMLLWYGSGRTEDTVRSGYYALFLGVVSLAVCARRDDNSFRVPVVTAVANAAQGTHLGASSAGKPMAVVVAIVQEFLLFQSGSGTLTREALIEMNEIVEALIEANGLEVAES